ncbi:MAG: hypothetical protein OHK93_005946 [Ramalina farinacea]|uniref:Integral membrane protein n=1 Tax=Ramalina farinacea TaxID=258253 RepID=A0AA43QKN8_9LECA|nr:hypothetical protein [Ramalina farinacea]
MFIGEMGCWLVVFLHYLYKRYISSSSAPLLHGGYAPVNGTASDAASPRHSDEEDRPSQDLSQSITSLPPPASSAAVAKSLLPSSSSHRRELSGSRVFYLAIPACCDITGTTLMNVGLLFVAASIYQMTRGALVLFVGLFSVMFLGRRLAIYKWSALFIVVLGVAIVGLAGAIAKDPQAQPDPRRMLLLIRDVALNGSDGEGKADAEVSAAVYTVIGVLMIALAQIFTATQFVLEEWILERYALEPLKVVGWEGIFGFTVTLVGMIILHFAVGRTDAGRNGYFDAVEGWREITSYRAIAVSSIFIMISIGGFNFFGISVTRSVSATARSTIDTCRTLFIWIVSLGLGWETFKWLQILGFAALVYGTFLFNDIVRPPCKGCADGRKEDKPLLEEEPVEHS